MHKTTDYYGPIVYSGFGNQDGTTPYDTQQAVYNQFFAELKTAVDILNAKASAGDVTFFPLVMQQMELLQNGNIVKWIKFANSLRLRLALRISNIDPEKAKLKVKATLSGYGVITANADNMAYLAEHPVKTYTGPWADINAGSGGM